MKDKTPEQIIHNQLLDKIETEIHPMYLSSKNKTATEVVSNEQAKSRIKNLFEQDKKRILEDLSNAELNWEKIYKKYKKIKKNDYKNIIINTSKLGKNFLYKLFKEDEVLKYKINNMDEQRKIELEIGDNLGCFLLLLVIVIGIILGNLFN